MDVQSAQHRADALQYDVDQLRNQLQAMQHPEHQELLIRNQFQYIKPNETVYKIIRSSPSQTKP